MRPPRFRINTLVLLTVIVALVLAIALQGRRERFLLGQLEMESARAEAWKGNADAYKGETYRIDKITREVLAKTRAEFAAYKKAHP
jgi:hypothetical protein